MSHLCLADRDWTGFADSLSDVAISGYLVFLTLGLIIIWILFVVGVFVKSRAAAVLSYIALIGLTLGCGSFHIQSLYAEFPYEQAEITLRFKLLVVGAQAWLFTVMAACVSGHYIFNRHRRPSVLRSEQFH